MAIRHFIILFSLFIMAGSSLARKASLEEKQDFINAKNNYKKGKYDTALMTLKRRYNLRKFSTPSGALELGARAYEKIGDYKEALVIYSVLIKKKYPKKNKTVIASYRKNSNADDIPEIDEKLSYYYYKKAFNTKMLYEESNEELYYKASKMFSEICMEGDHYDDEAEELFEAVAERNSEYKRLIFKRSKNLLVSYMSWQDNLTLISPSGQEQEIHSSSEGTCFGGGFNYANAYVNYKMEGCLALATAIVGEDSSNVDYFQSDVAQRALFLFPGAMWKPQAGSVSIGFSTPFVYRVGDFTEPEGFTIDGKSKLAIGLMLESNWRHKSFGVDFKFGKLFGFTSSTMSLGMNYHF
jgi:hypothetical protein